MAALKAKRKSEVLYGKTALGQLLYDLAFARLSPSYLARKHRLPVAEIRRLRATAVHALKVKSPWP